MKLKDDTPKANFKLTTFPSFQLFAKKLLKFDSSSFSCPKAITIQISVNAYSAYAPAQS